MTEPPHPHPPLKSTLNVPGTTSQVIHQNSLPLYILRTGCFSSDDDHRLWLQRGRSLHYVKRLHLLSEEGGPSFIVCLTQFDGSRHCCFLGAGTFFSPFLSMSRAEMKPVSFPLRHTPDHAALRVARALSSLQKGLRCWESWSWWWWSLSFNRLCLPVKTSDVLK